MTPIAVAPVAMVDAAEVTVLSASAVKPVRADLADAFRRETGHTIRLTFAALSNRAGAPEPARSFLAFVTRPSFTAKFTAAGLDYRLD